MACRSMDRAKEAAAEVKQVTGVPDDMIKIMKLDLSSLKSVREFAEKYKKGGFN